MPDPLNPGNTLYGVGCYQFGKNGALSAYGAEGAMAFTIGDGGERIGIAFAAPHRSIFYPSLKAGCAVAASLNPYSNDLHSFYDAVDPSDGKTAQSDSNATASLHGSINQVHAGQPIYDDPGFCVIVSVVPK